MLTADKHISSASGLAGRHLLNVARPAPSWIEKRGNGLDMVDDYDDPRYLSSAFGKRGQQQHFDETYADDDMQQQQQHFGK
jgi:hypothetical protein